jgi:hypothetical protein
MRRAPRDEGPAHFVTPAYTFCHESCHESCHEAGARRHATSAGKHARAGHSMDLSYALRHVGQLVRCFALTGTRADLSAHTAVRIRVDAG